MNIKIYPGVGSFVVRLVGGAGTHLKFGHRTYNKRSGACGSHLLVWDYFRAYNSSVFVLSFCVGDW